MKTFFFTYRYILKNYVQSKTFLVIVTFRPLRVLRNARRKPSSSLCISRMAVFLHYKTIRVVGEVVFVFEELIVPWRGVNRGRQIHRFVPFYAKSVDPPKFLFKSQITTTCENRGVQVQR